MVRFNFGNTPGIGNANGTYSGGFLYYVTTLPTGRAAENGLHPFIITAIEVVANGRFATVPLNVVIADESGVFPSGGNIDATGASAAQSIYSIPSYKGFTQGSAIGQKARITLTSRNGGLFFAGRNTGGPGAIIGSGGINRPGSMAGGFHYIQVPAAPAITTVRPYDDGTGAFIRWDAPIDTGESPLTGYRIQWATSPDMRQNLRTFDVPVPVADIIGLAPGRTYYWRITARNAVSDWVGALGGPWSSVIGAFQPGAGGVPGLGGMVSNGQAWVPSTWRVSNGFAYVPPTWRVSNGQAWVTLR